MDFTRTFGANGGKPLEYKGLLVYPGAKILVETGMRVVIQSVTYLQEPKQALFLNTRKCSMILAETEGSAFNVLAENMREGFELKFTKVHAEARLSLQNAWLHPKSKQFDSGINYFGMLREPLKDGRQGERLRCADGYLVKEPNFDSFVLEYWIL